MRGGDDDPLIVVLDTNVLLSALAFGGRTTARIWTLVEDNRFRLAISSFILEELERNLVAKADFSPSLAKNICSFVLDLAEPVRPTERISVITRKDSDNRILECAIAANADMIVTGNLVDIRPLGEFRGVRILTPREFLDEFFPV